MSRRRRHKHDEHANHEAWAIPFGDLVTLLLAFFVVMYAISSVNSGKYRVLSESLAAAFKGAPRSLEVAETGEEAVVGDAPPSMTVVEQAIQIDQSTVLKGPTADEQAAIDAAAAMRRMAEQLETALGPLIDANLISVRRTAEGIEVEMRADILFPSGSAALSSSALPVLNRVAATLRTLPNYIRVEGHTDDVPLRGNSAYPSNWELSAARAASVVHLFTDQAIGARRLSVAAFGEQRPVQTNATPEGRNANRRVIVMILGEMPPPSTIGTDSAAAPSSR